MWYAGCVIIDCIQFPSFKFGMFPTSKFGTFPTSKFGTFPTSTFGTLLIWKLGMLLDITKERVLPTYNFSKPTIKHNEIKNLTANFGVE